MRTAADPIRDLFRDVSEKHWKEAAPHFHEVTFGVAEPLMEAKDDDPVLAMIVEGHVEIVRKYRVIDTSGPGAILGEMSFFTGKPRIASVYATEDTSAWVLAREAYDELRARNNEVVFVIEREILRQLGARLHVLDEKLAAIADEASPYFKPAPGMFDRLKTMLFGTGEPEVPEPRKVDAAQILERSSLFAGESSLTLRVIGSSLVQETFAAGTYVCTQGEPAEKLYVVAGGTVDVVVAGADSPGPEASPTIHRLGVLRPGAVFGTTSIEGPRPRRATFIAREPLDLLSLDRETVASLVQTSGRHGSTLRVALIRALASQQNAAGAAVADSLAGNAALRASAVIELTGRFDPGEDEL